MQEFNDPTSFSYVISPLQQHISHRHCEFWIALHKVPRESCNELWLVSSSQAEVLRFPNKGLWWGPVVDPSDRFQAPFGAWSSSGDWLGLMSHLFLEHSNVIESVGNDNMRVCVQAVTRNDKSIFVSRPLTVLVKVEKETGRMRSSDTYELW